jgi:hypothetical protein
MSLIANPNLTPDTVGAYELIALDSTDTDQSKTDPQKQDTKKKAPPVRKLEQEVFSLWQEKKEANIILWN